MSLPDPAAVSAYLGANASTYDEATITSALAAETAAQARVCRVDEANYPADLQEALLRRVARNLAMRALPLGVMADPEGGAIRPGSNDPEIRRLEAPYRKRVVG